MLLSICFMTIITLISLIVTVIFAIKWKRLGSDDSDEISDEFDDRDKNDVDCMNRFKTDGIKIGWKDDDGVYERPKKAKGMKRVKVSLGKFFSGVKNRFSGILELFNYGMSK